MAVIISGNGIDMGNNPVSNASQIDSSLINASQVDSTEIVISETTWNNPDGVEYADSGIQGVPDTSFSSTGARIYPDGTIRGKSSYGEYVKYPNGEMRIIITVNGSVNSSTSPTGTAMYPHIFSSSAKSYSFMQTNVHGDSNYGRSLIWMYSGTTTSSFGYKIAPDDGITSTLAGISFAITVNGTWK